MYRYLIYGLTFFLLFYAVYLYNRLVRLKNKRKNAFADIDVLLKQRHDLVPQLVESVRGYMKHEEKVLTNVTEARSHAVEASTIEGKISAEARLTSALRGLNIAVEAYPNLKADQNFMHLQREITNIENRIASTRSYFNSATMQLNNAVEMFPSNIVALLSGFSQASMFDLGSSERQNLDETPEIDFER